MVRSQIQPGVRPNHKVNARSIGNHSVWCYFSIAVTLCSQYLLRNDTAKKSCLWPVKVFQKENRTEQLPFGVISDFDSNCALCPPQHSSKWKNLTSLFQNPPTPNGYHLYTVSHPRRIISRTHVQEVHKSLFVCFSQSQCVSVPQQSRCGVDWLSCIVSIKS